MLGFFLKIAIYDACWMVPMIVLGAFAARREDVNHGDFRMVSLNKGAFGVTAVPKFFIFFF